MFIFQFSSLPCWYSRLIFKGCYADSVVNTLCIGYRFYYIDDHGVRWFIHISCVPPVTSYLFILFLLNIKYIYSQFEKKKYHFTTPSGDEEKNSAPILELIKSTFLAKSRCATCGGQTPAGSPPLRVSHQPTCKDRVHRVGVNHKSCNPNLTSFYLQKDKL